MSDLTPCNFCSFRRIREHAKPYGLKVIKRSGWRGGMDIFVIPKDVDPKALKLGDHEPDRQKYFVAWFQKLTPFCVC